MSSYPGARIRASTSLGVGVALFAYLAVYGSSELWSTLPSDRQKLLENVGLWPIVLAAVWTTLEAAQRTRSVPRLRRAWLLLAMAAASSAVGQVVTAGQQLHGDPPFPSFADIAFLAFYPLMLGGILSFPVLRRSSRERLRLGLDLTVVALGGSAGAVLLVLGPTAIAGGSSLAESVFSIAYPVGDIVLFAGVGTLLLRGSVPSARAAQQLLAGSLALYACADLVDGYHMIHPGFRAGDSLSSVLWIGAVLLFMLAGSRQPAVSEPEAIPETPARINALPYLAVVFGFTVLLFAHRSDAFYPGLLMTVIAIALAGLVLLRQYLAQLDVVGAQERLRHQALHDGLTGIPNRTLFEDRLAQALARSARLGTHVAVLLLDLDDFKLLNDTLGHAAGDRLLVEVASRLVSVTRAGETTARLGGDEFAVIAEGALGEPELDALARRLLRVFDEPFSITHGTARRIRGSLGIAYTHDASAEPEELLRDADTAMYRAKSRSKSGYELFDSALRAELVRQVELVEALEVAVTTDGLRVDYQPIVATATGRPLAVEALVRWRDERFGDVAPDEFIPLAERSGLVVQLGRAVVRQAVAHLEACRRADPEALPLGVFVNCSPRELAEPDYCEYVTRELHRHGLATTDLAVELTERVFIDDRNPTIARTVDDLTRDGVRLVLDDFGTGYSALASLKRFPLHAVKIDRYFVNATVDASGELPVTHAIISLGKTLDLLVIAEGVETHEQLRRLRALGCDAVQGYLLGRPSPRICAEKPAAERTAAA